jgi:RNA polymerase sigma factor (TIGR02999 family)
MENITELIRQVNVGDSGARERLFATAYDELKTLARSRLRDGGRNVCLDTTALVHESYLKFVNSGQLRQDDRRAFFAYASRVMRSVIVDSVRERQAERRGGNVTELTLNTAISSSLPATEQQMLDVHEALEALEQAEPRLAKVVEMRYFGGYTEIEIADALDLTERTVRRDWDKARMILAGHVRVLSPIMPIAAQDLVALSRLLDEAMDLPPVRLEAWLDALPAEHAHLAPQLRRMLAARTGAPEFLQSTPRLATDESVAHAGDLVGAYRLVREIGHGGMGDVWLADRADGSLKRNVALKLPRLAWGAGLADRIARERDIGALLEHPNIARLYDAGIDERGRPFLALEYVDGVPLDQWCKSNALSITSGCACSCRSRARSRMRTAVSSCIGTSSPPTCSSPPTARRTCSTSASPSCSTTARPRATSRRSRGACSRRTTPRPSRSAARRSPSRRTCTRSACCSTSC